ncbi:molecular chaperone HscC [Paenibacillus phyllosphaerae]|uniref:Chaperone protein DnaK n=1 Tax=Paenibacillus phyllosphaerae TaxID=274593 RepID=A0A7W5AYB0_9BACL|nr:molecular chaperone HscC [Paenibacillus phyllosphaerae]MBB3110837.1 molecular chaperone HscC [Paenibacillus phyllosphaerae]
MAIIGIDLGTTNSLVTYCAGEEAIVIPNALGQHLTPSVVSRDEDGGILVGQIAKERLISHPHATAAVFKRYMGSKKTYRLGDKEFLPEELSALVIQSLKADAEHYLGQPVHEAVISVPAYFSDAQRKATKRAGEMAGLRVERLITEPTAAALAYGIHLKDADTKFLVFDLGGGTFDVSILELFDQVMEVRAVAGDNYLGGEDFTEVLTAMFMKHHGLKAEEIEPQTQALIYKQAEEAKRQFASQRHAIMTCPVADSLLTFEVTLEQYEEASKGLLQRLREPIERALRDASLKVRDIEAILLVGGAAKLPFIRTFVSRLFGKLAYANVNPDEIVGIGSGIQAALKERNASFSEVVLTDVCPYTLGTSVAFKRSGGFSESGHFCPIIERNTVIPVSRMERFFTMADQQKLIRIDILQGEARLSRDNIFLGELNVPVPSKRAGEEAVDVRYTYDVNGLLEVEVTVVSTGLKKSLVIEKDPGHMTKEEIAGRLEELSGLKIHPRELQDNKWLVARGERLYEERIGEERGEIARLLRLFEEALDQQEPKQIAEMKQQLRDIFDTMEGQGGL